MSRPLRVAGYIAIGIVSGLLLASAAIWLLTRTEWGHERARRFAVSWLAERVNGELRIGRVSGRGLLGGVTIHDFGIVDPKGRPFLSTDSLQLEYDWRTLLGGRVVLNRVVLYDPHIVMEQLPGDTAWNFEHVFRDTTPGDARRERSLIMFRDARVVNGTAIVRTPFEPSGPLQPSDTARMVLEQVPGGVARTMRFDRVNSRLDRVIWESPLEKGRLFDIRSLQGRGFVWRDPFLIRDARGTLTTRDSIVSFDMQEVALPGSQAAVLGRVVMEHGRNSLDIRVDGRRLRFRDLQWLYPALPDEGGGSLVLRIQTQPQGVLFLAEDARLSAPGTRLSGTVGVVAGDTLYFTRVDLRASPLDVRFIERLLPGGLPVEGLLVGTVEVQGPLSALETSGRLELTGDTRGAGSALAWNGVFDVRNGTPSARSLRADVERLDLGLLSAIPGVHLAGTVSGRVEGSGRRDRLRFNAALEHRTGAGVRSRFDGGGSIEGTGRRRRLDVTVNASSVTLQDLARHIPALQRLQGLQGQLAGPLRVAGTADDLEFEADLGTSGGPLSLKGRFDRQWGRPHLAATAEAQGFRLDAFRTGLPDAGVSGRLHVDLTGATLEDASGDVHLLVDSLRLGDLPPARLAFDGTIAAGLMRVDSAALRTAFGTGHMAGEFGLVPGRRGELVVRFTSESLAPLESWVFAEPAASAAEPRLAGRLDAAATLTGWLREVDVSATARGTGLVYGDLAASHLRADLNGAGPRLRLTAAADSVRVGGHTFSTAHLDAGGAPDSIAVTLRADAPSRSPAGECANRGHCDDEKVFARALVRRATGLVPTGTSDGSLSGGAATTLFLEELRVGGGDSWALSAPAVITSGDGVARVSGLDLRRKGGGRMLAAGYVPWVFGAAAPPEDERSAGVARAAPDSAAGGTVLPPASRPSAADRQASPLSALRLPFRLGARTGDDGDPAPAARRRLQRYSEAGTGLPVSFELQLSEVPFSDVLRLLQSRQQGAGELEGTLRLTGTAQDPRLEAEVSGRDLRYGDVLVDRGAAELSYAGLGLDLNIDVQHGGRSILSGGGRIPLDLRLVPLDERRLDKPLRLALSADSLPPGLPLGLLDGFTEAAGRLDGTLAVRGTTLEPALSGGFTLSNGAVRWSASGVKYRDVNGSIGIEHDREVRVDLAGRAAAARNGVARSFTGTASGGTASVSGTLDFTQLSDPLFDLAVVADRTTGALRRDVEAVVTGNVHLGGRYSRPEISGSLTVNEGSLYLDEIYRQYLIVGLQFDDPSLLSLVDTSLVAIRPLLALSKNPFLRGLRIRNMQVAVGADSWLRSRDMDVEVAGNLTVAFDRRDEDLRLTGSLNVERGTYSLYYPPLQSRRFRVRQGTIEFPGTPGIDPNLAITAAYRARARGEPLDVLAIVSGTLQNPRVRLASNAEPPIGESDLASYLFFGVPTGEVAEAGPGQSDVRAVAGLGVRALGPSVLGYASSGLQTLVQNAGLLDFVSLTAAEPVAAHQTASGLGGLLAGTEIEVGRYAFDSRLFLGYTQRLGGASYDPAMRLEWRFKPEYSFELFAEDRFARTPAFGPRPETGLRKVYGFSFFREWGF